MRTVAETPLFAKYASEVWSEPERVEFINWIAANAESGDVIPGSGIAELRKGVEDAI